jgi:hypothetical protein
MSQKRVFKQRFNGNEGPSYWGPGVILLASLFLASCADLVQLTNTSEGEHGLFVDGDYCSTGPDNDRRVVSNTPTVELGRMKDRGTTNGVVAFTRRRAVTVVSPESWDGCNGSVTLPLQYQAEIPVPVTIWIVRGSFFSQAFRAVDALVTTTSIWQTERMGVRFGAIRIVDATADPDASRYAAFTCANRFGLESDIGKDEGRINIYYVNTVDGGSSRGQACKIGSDFVALGSTTLDDLLSHEIGHDFGLFHVNGEATFDQTNIMHSASSTREYATEGQIYRAHLRPQSAINAVYNARVGLPRHDCGHGVETDTCLHHNRRAWPDGTTPAN